MATKATRGPSAHSPAPRESFKVTRTEGDEDLDDVEGHNFLPDPNSARVLWRARDAELARRAEHGRAARDAQVMAQAASPKRGR